MPRIYFIVGEASGDLHASNLVKALKSSGPHWEFKGFGGDKMAAEGVQISKHYRDMAFMGFSQVLLNLVKILGNIKTCKSEIQAFKPDAVVFVDFPGFNLRIAPFVKSLGIKTIYYISPQIWAWKESRVEQIKRDIDLMLCILPFEKAFYQKHNYTAEYVGHPLLDALQNHPFESREDIHSSGEKHEKWIALLPGSRKQEIKALLPDMMALARNKPNYLFLVACSPSQEIDFYHKVAGDIPTNVQWISGKTYSVVKNCDAAVVASGTATLETALIGTPQVVVYKGNFFNYLIARSLVKVKYISLVNLIADKKVVTELIQEDYNTQNLLEELDEIVDNEQVKNQQKDDYALLRESLGGNGASKRAAELIKNALL